MKRPTLNMDITKMVQNGQLDAVVQQLTPFTLLQGSARRRFCDRHQAMLSSAFLEACQLGRHTLVPLFLPLVRGGRIQAARAAASAARPLVIRALLEELDDKGRGEALLDCVGAITSYSSPCKRRTDLLSCMDLLLEKGAKPILPALKKSIDYFDQEVFALIAQSDNFNDQDVHEAFASVVDRGNTRALALLLAIHKPPMLPPSLLSTSFNKAGFECIRLLIPLCNHVRAIELIDTRWPIKVPVLDAISQDLSMDACRKLRELEYNLPKSLLSRLESEDLVHATREVELTRPKYRI